MKKLRIGFLSETSYYLHFNQLLEGIMQSAETHNVDIIRLMAVPTNFVHHPDQFKLFIDLISRLELDGLIYLGWMAIVGETAAAKAVFGPLNIPYVSLGKYHQDIPSVYQNGYSQISKLIDHVVQVHGLRRIVFIHPINADDRLQGYRDYMEGLKMYDPLLEVTPLDLGASNDYDFDVRAQKIVSVIYDEKKIAPEAILSLYSHEASTLMELLKERGFRLPEDVKVLCWEDVETSRYYEIPITAFYYPFKELGFEACEKLVAIIRGKNPPLVTELLGKLMVRNSCGCHMPSLELIEWGIKEKQETVKILPDHQSTGKPPAQLIDAETAKRKCREAVAGKNDEEFIRFLEGLLYHRNYGIQDIHNLRDELLRLRYVLRREFSGDRNDLERIETLSLKAQLLIQDKVEQLSGKMVLSILEQSWANINMNQFIASSFKFNLIFEVLTRFLKRNRINCYLYIFGEKGNEWRDLSLRFAFREGKILELSESDRAFDQLKKIIYYKKEPQLLFTHLLCIRDEWIGVVFFEPGPINERIYQDLSVQLSSSIKSAVVVENLETANRKLAELDDVKNDFIANITHDFRSPLMIILNSTDLGLKYDKNQDMEIVRKRYHTIFEASLKLKNTIDKLLDLAKMDSQGIKIHVCDIPLNLWLENIIEFYQSATVNTGITISTRFPPHEVKDFYSDPEKLEEVFNNIISNAFKFINPDHGEIRIELKDLDEVIRIEVADNGVGIPRENLETIFKRFEQIHEAGKGPYRGTGIGLAFSRQLIAFLQGRIWAESDGPGKGSRFVIELKKGKAHFHPEEMEGANLTPFIAQGKRQELHHQITSELTGNKKIHEAVTIYKNTNREGEFDYQKAVIMIVDDNHTIREIEVEYLEKAGYANFVLAPDGLQGIEAALQYHPDLILCDYNLPGMKGDQLHDQLVNNPDFRKIPFIFLTALDDKSVILERKRQGAIAYLVKPVDESDLVLTVEIHLKKYMELKAMMYQAARDELTGINNKRHLLCDLKKQLAIRTYRDLSVVFIDLDHFKRLNDSFGHVTGDAMLAAIGKLIRSTIRPYDVAGRYGGDEFVLILPETSAEQALVVAEKIKGGMERIALPSDGKHARITASFGIASLIKNQRTLCAELGVPDLRAVFEPAPDDGPDWADLDRKKNTIADILLRLADTALYVSKRTTCGQCSFQSEREELFTHGACPECGSRELDPGRGRITVCPE